ncbi:MAG: ABC transporter ATP-binding protein [Nitrososphaerota archaeon]|nr:ABC transporter ATP-binding protein [Candidatus Calditenuaceae archaeon]MDW8073623.1 ABC transporter ATP-binding protein [Nitrososphaerota archaeon]
MTGGFIEVDQLLKKYRDGVLVGPISLSSPRGVIYGLVGPNGSGKTTTIRCMLGLQKPSKGHVRVAGLDPASESKKLMQITGYSQELPSFPPFLTAKDILTTTGKLKGLSGEELRREVSKALDISGLVSHAGRRVGSFSKGMLQRLAVAQAIIGDPEILILDEPMLGVDPAARVQMREIFMELKRAGKTILFSSHELYELERLADMVGMMYQGRVMVEGWVKELLSQDAGGLKVEAEVLRPSLITPQLIQSLKGVQDFQMNGTILRVRFAEGLDGRETLAATLVKSGAGLVRLQTVNRTLEDLFMEVVMKGVKP